MADERVPQDPPPPYSKQPETSRLEVPGSASVAARRSMEDELRPLPEGWVRQYDAQNAHQFFVDTRAEPPRSIWHHPHDDEEFLAALSSEERERIQDADSKRQSKAQEDTSDPPPFVDAAGPSSSRPRPQQTQSTPEIQRSSAKPGFGTRLKDKLTGTTHEQREEERRQRDEEEARLYALHDAFRAAMSRAIQTGQPQFVARHPDGHDVYVEPPQFDRRTYGNPANYRGYSPYTQGPYANPNARFIRPPGPYSRPYGSRGRHGMGLPIAGGLAGGLLLGGLLGGF